MPSTFKRRRQTTKPVEISPEARFERIKRLVIVAMFSDDDLMERLVLKGGNALDLVFGVAARASVDVDFSMAGDFDEDLASVHHRLERALVATLRAEKLHP